MATENGEQNNDDWDDKAGTQEQVDTSDPLNKALDDYIEETSRDTRTPTVDKTKAGEAGEVEGKGQQQPQQGQRGNRNREQPQPNANGEDVDRPPTRNPISATPRQIGTMFRSDENGAILSADGRLIAHPGSQRKVFERVARLYQGMEVEHASLKEKVNGYESANLAARDAGLSLEEHTASLRLMSAWKKDKLGTLNFLLNEAAQGGIDVSSIRAGGGLDVGTLRSALTEIVKEHLQPFMPFVEQREQDAQTVELRNQAHQQLSEFYEEFPDAQMHAGAIAAIMQKKAEQGTPWSMRESYLALSAHAARSGWDMSQPLNVQATGNGQQNGARRANPNGEGNSRRLPSMNGRDAGRREIVEAGSRTSAAADDSWDSILGGVAKDFGLNVE